MTLVRVVLALAFICSSLVNFPPVSAAFADAKGAVSGSLEHSHAAMSGLDHTDEDSSVMGSASKECIPDGKSHSGHGKSSDCCAAICFDLTVLSSEGHGEGKLPSVQSIYSLESIIAVGPVQVLRPPRA